jgi:undecaprenyl-diphosphatase
MRRCSKLLHAGVSAFTERDAALALAVNHWSDIGWLRALLRATSRLGDGVFWYVLMAGLLAVIGEAAFRPVMQMITAGTIGVALYKVLKHRTLRPRPYQVRPDIRLCGIALDHYSFPSGHTLHAVALTLIAAAHFPALGPVLLPFTLLVGLSRVVLGLHYPSDVVAGALLGVSVAVVVLGAS